MARPFNWILLSALCSLCLCGESFTVKLWDGAGNAVRTFDALPDVALCTAFTHDDIRVIGGDWTGQVLMWTGAGGKAVGSMTPNPPTLAERLDAAQKDVAAKQAARDQKGGERQGGSGSGRSRRSGAGVHASGGCGGEVEGGAGEQIRRRAGGVGPRRMQFRC